MESAVRYCIGIPVYNQAKTIRNTLLSVLDQDGYFDEIVVSDNHSTDGTAEIVGEFSGRVRIVRPAKHVNPTENFNYCVSQMACDWFSLLSGDDYLYRDYAIAMRAAIVNNRQAVLIRGGVDVVDGERRIRSSSSLRSVAKRVSYPRNVKQQLQNPRVSFACFAADKRIWQKVGGFPDDLILVQDWGFWLLLARHGQFVKAGSKPLAQYTVISRPDVDEERVPLFFQDACHIYQWIRERGVIDLSDRNVCRLYRLRFLNFLEHFRGSSESARGLAQPFVEELGRLGGYSPVQVQQRLEHGATAYDKGWLKTWHIVSLLRDVWWRVFL